MRAESCARQRAVLTNRYGSTPKSYISDCELHNPYSPGFRSFVGVICQVFEP